MTSGEISLRGWLGAWVGRIDRCASRSRVVAGRRSAAPGGRSARESREPPWNVEPGLRELPHLHLVEPTTRGAGVQSQQNEISPTGNAPERHVSAMP